jgi:hypothetical protein
MARTDEVDELFERGERIANDPTLNGMLIGDPPRPVTNMEILAFIHYRQTLEQRKRGHHGDAR